jgi:hypothetical protein
MLPMNKMNIYSVFSGTYYTIPESDFKILDVGQLPLTKTPPRNCKKCHGRGHLGRDKMNYVYAVCSCVRKCINFDIIKSAENIKV